MKQIQTVTGPGEIAVKPRILRVQPIVGRIIDAAKAERWAKMISFCGMIINHVENYFDSGSVQAAHHRFELADLLADLSGTGIFCMRSEKADRVIAPIVR